MAAALIMPTTEARTKRMVEGYIVRLVKGYGMKAEEDACSEDGDEEEDDGEENSEGAGGGYLYLCTSLPLSAPFLLRRDRPLFRQDCPIGRTELLSKSAEEEEVATDSKPTLLPGIPCPIPEGSRRSAPFGGASAPRKKISWHGTRRLVDRRGLFRKDAVSQCQLVSGHSSPAYRPSLTTTVFVRVAIWSGPTVAEVEHGVLVRFAKLARASGGVLILGGGSAMVHRAR